MVSELAEVTREMELRSDKRRPAVATVPAESSH